MSSYIQVAALENQVLRGLRNPGSRPAFRALPEKRLRPRILKTPLRAVACIPLSRKMRLLDPWLAGRPSQAWPLRAEMSACAQPSTSNLFWRSGFGFRPRQPKPPAPAPQRQTQQQQSPRDRGDRRPIHNRAINQKRAHAAKRQRQQRIPNHSSSPPPPESSSQTSSAYSIFLSFRSPPTTYLDPPVRCQPLPQNAMFTVF